MKNDFFKKFRFLNKERKEKRTMRRRGDLKPHRVAILAIMKNEKLNLEEWVQHYIWQGADRIFLIDNGSTDGSYELALELAIKHPVDVIQLTGRWAQLKHYWTAIKKFHIRRNYQWLLIADLDEFWMAKRNVTIAEELSHLTYFDVIYLNWTEFGSNGYKSHPESLRTCLTKRQAGLGSHLYTKYACNTSIIRKSAQVGMHKVYGANSARVISANDLFQINHYRTQSVYFWQEVKLKRGDAARKDYENARSLREFKAHEKMCVQDDFEIASRLAASNEFIERH